jgi:hypothetical protein
VSGRERSGTAEGLRRAFDRGFALPARPPRQDTVSLLAIRLAGAPAALRVHVWRRLRSLGGLYLQQSLCLLPARDTTVRAVRRLLDRVHRDGGQGRVLQVA